VIHDGYPGEPNWLWWQCLGAVKGHSSSPMRTNGDESLGPFNLANATFESARRAFEHVPSGFAHVTSNSSKYRWIVPDFKMRVGDLSFRNSALGSPPYEVRGFEPY